MRTIALVIEYDGTAYVGWQSQQNGPSIQETLCRALEQRTGAPASLTGAGRTDAGVHALGQVATFGTAQGAPLTAFREGLNVLLPADIRVVEAREAREGFHPIRCAESKIYLYRLLLRGVGSALEHHRAWKLPKEPDVGAMREAAKAFIGTHDYTSFCAADAEPNRTKTLTRIDIIEHAGLTAPELHIEVEGSGFLKQMVRTITGSLVDVGRGKRPPGWIAETLKARDRRLAGLTAPAWGLYLKQVGYAPDWFTGSTGQFPVTEEEP
ncbi:MAG: tRNA pseudouridine(38-40) synthase TruA [Deltaproteobacteria bacterium]|nr:tRNA pseudouridine(38-40) synthase TruA [Deltaproteobacteria bacterium]